VPGAIPIYAGDPDAGPNNLQNFPVLTAANSAGGNTNIQGTLNSTPNKTFKLDFFSNDACNPTGFGEGQTFLDSFKVTTDASGNAAFNALLSGITLLPGAVITSTATDPNNNTSEFSACLPTGGTVETADLELTKKADKIQYAVGDQVLYTIQLINKGPSNATGITVTDLLPAGVTFIQSTATAGTYNNTTGKWVVAALNTAQQATLTIRGTLTAAGSITNTAEITASNVPDPDSSPGNGVSTEDDQSSVSVSVTQQPDVTLQYRLLMQQITALVSSGRLTAREARILNGIVEVSLRLENRGQIQAAIVVLRVFNILVRTATQRTRLTDADRRALILAAQKIIDQLRAMPARQSSPLGDTENGELKTMEDRARQELMGFGFVKNYPNPFTDYAVITFDVADEGRVQLNVYDANGRMVTSLLDKVVQPGVQTVTWRTPNLPAGVYVLQLRVGDFVTTYKMVHVQE
jgi:uncharacterized repeat protein (TIGR01451 family)